MRKDIFENLTIINKGNVKYYLHAIKIKNVDKAKKRESIKKVILECGFVHYCDFFCLVK